MALHSFHMELPGGGGRRVCREQLIRLIAATLEIMGYSQSSIQLQNESGVLLMDPQSQALSSAVHAGQWDHVVELIRRLSHGVDETTRKVSVTKDFAKCLEDNS